MTVAKTGRPPGESVLPAKLKPAPEQLTDQQANGILKFFRENPHAGYQAALKSIGFHAPSEQAKALILVTAGLGEHIDRQLRVSENALKAVIGDVAADPDHKDQLRAAIAGLKMFHGYSETPTTVSHEHSGDVSFVIESAFPADVIDGEAEEADDGDTGPAALPR